MSLTLLIMIFWIATCCLWMYRETILTQEIEALMKELGIIDLREIE